MIEIKDVETFGFEAAIRGMRNPYMSHDKSDSVWICLYPYNNITNGGNHFVIGEADLALAKKLIKAGSEHRKFLRMIHVQADVLAPRYWWAEMDKYKYVEANSSSTMHLITTRYLTMADFSTDGGFSDGPSRAMDGINILIQQYHDAKGDPDRQGFYFRTIKQFLPESFNQLRTIDTNYECLLSIYGQRKNHRLNEWKEFCKWIARLPYMDEFMKFV